MCGCMCFIVEERVGLFRYDAHSPSIVVCGKNLPESVSLLISEKLQRLWDVLSHCRAGLDNSILLSKDMFVDPVPL